MSTQAPIKAALVLQEAERELASHIAAIKEIEEGLEQSRIDGEKEWNSFSWIKRYWSWCDSAEKWGQSKHDEYNWKHEKMWRRRKASKLLAEGLIKLAVVTEGDVLLSVDDANFLNINNDEH